MLSLPCPRCGASAALPPRCCCSADGPLRLARPVSPCFRLRPAGCLRSPSAAPAPDHSNAKTVLGCAGYHGDVLTLIKRIERRMTMYEHAHHKPMR